MLSGRGIKVRDLGGWRILISKLYRNCRVRRQPVEEAGLIVLKEVMNLVLTGREMGGPYEPA